MYCKNAIEIAQVLDAVASLREGRGEEGVLKLWPNYVTGEDLFGLTEPAVVRVLESLPGNTFIYKLLLFIVKKILSILFINLKRYFVGTR